MDISSVAKMDLVAPFTPKLKELAGTSKPAAQVVSMPQVRQLSVGSENPQSTASPPNSAELHDLVDKANAALPANASNLKFSVAEGTHINVVRIEDTETGELIRQIPSETMLAIARAFSEDKHGTMLEDQA
jgi:flagellar protein FlaG